MRASANNDSSFHYFLLFFYFIYESYDWFGLCAHQDHLNVSEKTSPKPISYYLLPKRMRKLRLDQTEDRIPRGSARKKWSSHALSHHHLHCKNRKQREPPVYSSQYFAHHITEDFILTNLPYQPFDALIKLVRCVSRELPIKFRLSSFLPSNPYLKSMAPTLNPKCLKTAESCDSFLIQKNRSILRHRTQVDSLNSSFKKGDDEESSSAKRGVGFGVIRLCEHPILLGDNPGGNRGPPLTIDWYAQDTYEMDIEEYEGERPPRRNQSQLSLPESVRKDILKKCGYSRNEIVEQTKPVNQARQRRKATVQSAKLEGIQELMEKVSRKTFNAISLGRRKRQERNLLERCRSFDSTKLSSRSTLATSSDGGSYTDSVTECKADDEN